MSQRLRRAAEDLKRMQAEYEELQAQAHGERGEQPGATSGTPAKLTDSHASEAVERCSHHTARSSLHHRPGSFRPGHRNLEHDYTSYFDRQQQPAPVFRGVGGERRDNLGADDERIEQCSTIRTSSSEEETRCSVDTARYDTSVFLLVGSGLTLCQEFPLTPPLLLRNGLSSKKTCIVRNPPLVSRAGRVGINVTAASVEVSVCKIVTCSQLLLRSTCPRRRLSFVDRGSTLHIPADIHSIPGALQTG